MGLDEWFVSSRLPPVLLQVVPGGVVYLVGRVGSRIGREAAESDAIHVEDVVTVDNRLRVEGWA